MAGILMMKCLPAERKVNNDKQIKARFSCTIIQHKKKDTCTGTD